ncbi:undecaprenyldiphospho-muramoylpentapeptide beta-N-acetylglucosaminyltransferase [Paenibacillus aurantius]|uniref:UDP-N-acetylglucosamine--N-acetylmuramyl-(pentapeptide) pyrophosphoryl-undecaprenol N-acetylglucosamine transferase n=1 Tax=Paenibacillus aurantius TaxID=2918900 RepID=A0AA96LIA8_9BACL|nr:undecaprenyldiphospho-muramoylpentapeptide beta-N-acetylglucosaminyltransferase [Paenibacillus aurantius]WNQ13518.1 undecaprenyldiphospho-muramoylpentapeptide beta-N-acetylglucosaminyltransferase [Paenibacillus aurantius]
MRIVLSGGGTGGHVYPALSIMEEVRREQPGSEFLYIGTSSGLEKGIVAKADPKLRFEAIEISGFRRKLSLDNVRTVIRFLKGVGRAKKLLREFKPDVVIGTGGYVCGPVVYAAAKLGIPTMIHEQNVIPGLTNKFLSRYTDTVAVSFQGSEGKFPGAKRVVYTGNPRATTVVQADALKGLSSLGLPEGSRLVVAVGGSRGAKAVNEAVAAMAPLMAGLPDVQFLFVTGEPYYEATRQQILAKGKTMPDNLLLVPYVHNMHEVLAATSLIISRAGASFLAEITALGIPSLLIPSPNVTNNHQEANARWLEKENAAKVILERDLNGTFLYAQVERIMKDPGRHSIMSRNSARMGNREAAGLFYSEMLKLASR